MGVVRRSAIVFFVLLALPACALALVNINTADLTTLETLNGIGPSKAQAIINYRTQNGPFATISDIQNVSGIGTVTYSNIKDFITVGDSQSAAQSPATSTDTTQTTQSQTQSAPTPSYVPPPVPEVFADAGADRTVIVGADTEFDGRAYNRDKVLLDKVRYMWNFGDGSTAEGPAVLHHYDYPGEYAVVLDVAAGTASVGDELIVTAEPAKLAFTVNADGSVSIENLAGRDLDLSFWHVSSYNELFTLPSHSIILTNETMRIPHTTLKFYANLQSTLQYPNGVVALAANQSTESAPAAPVSAAQAVAPQPQAKPPAAPAVSVKLQTASAQSDGVAPTSNATDTGALSQTAAASVSAEGLSWWWLGALALALIGGGGIYAIRRQREGEWDIEG
jgi:competence protein ComEA